MVIQSAGVKRTSFTKVGIGPATLQVDIGDLAFASSTGSLRHSGSTTVTSMAYGVAMACIAPGNAAGVANVNLTGTPFQVTSTFATGGSSPAGTAAVSHGHQVVNLTGGGFCGWMMSAPGAPGRTVPLTGSCGLSCGRLRVVLSASADDSGAS